MANQHVIKVACGSSDAHTLCLTKQGKVFSWGDGDYGKLGRGGSDGSKVPKIIETLENVEIADVACGAHFSIALTKDGKVYSWGKGESWRLGHGTEEHVRFPEIIQTLQDKVVVSISLGAAHVLALTNEGEIYGWGKNENKQICDSNKMFIQTPRLVESLKDNRIVGIACGPSQSFAWTDVNFFTPKTSLPFVIDLNETTFKLINKILENILNNNTRPVMTQDRECLTTATLNLLHLQVI